MESRGASAGSGRASGRAYIARRSASRLDSPLRAASKASKITGWKRIAGSLELVGHRGPLHCRLARERWPAIGQTSYRGDGRGLNLGRRRYREWAMMFG